VKARKGAGVLLTVVGATAIVSGVLVPAHDVVWRHDEAVAYADAKREGKIVMVDFWAKWCAPCRKLETLMGEDKINRVLAENFVPLKIDVTAGSEADEALKKKYSAATLPALIFMDADGNEIGRADVEHPDSASILDALQRARDGGFDGQKPCVASK
jgi:thiol:disulfide interchange protein DsbD